MKLKNEILKLAVSWKAQDPQSLNAFPEWTSPYEGLRWKLMDWENLGTVAVQTECAPGLDFPYHLHHAHDEVLTVLEGYAEIEIIKTTHTLRAGESILIPKGVLHRGVYPEGAKVLLVFNK